MCAQFEAVLQHGLRKSRGLALTAAALKQAAGFSSKTEAELTFWFYVKEHLNRHELQRFLSLRQISCELGRGRAWLRCALNEHSLERYLHTLLSERPRLGTYYEDWAFILDEERASMLPTMAAGLNSILFAINIDNTDLNGGVVGGRLLGVRPPEGVDAGHRQPVEGVDSGDSGLRKERRRKKKITNIISFDDDLDGGAEDEEEGEEELQKVSVMRNSLIAPAQSSVEEGVDPLDPEFSESPAQNGLSEPGIVSWVGSPHPAALPPHCLPSST
ncbi:hypothetical protein F7725_013996 [Dissostichus mawsoni]|uniref:RUN domain-containing protein n=1 Tax=Dissostichus mawsoni TaxID=36200 RepID=A0A7J5YZ13_DISMA|nr:hypothetical protein F7725_013996 [Dissostichus mawsoni]